MVMDQNIKILIPRRKIAATVKKLAAEIQQDYADKNPLLIGILKGSFIFMSDLVRQINIPLEIDFIRLSSYGTKTCSSGTITLVHELPSRVQDRHVLVVEDIIDTGLTTDFLLDYLRKKGPASLKLCALTEKPSRRQTPTVIDYLGFSIPDKFVVGYGLDFSEKYRNLPDICFVEEVKP